MDLTDMYRIFHPTAAECIYFSSAHGTFSKIDHVKQVLTNTILASYQIITEEIRNQQH